MVYGGILRCRWRILSDFAGSGNGVFEGMMLGFCTYFEAFGQEPCLVLPKRSFGLGKNLTFFSKKALFVFPNRCLAFQKRG